MSFFKMIPKILTSSLLDDNTKGKLFMIQCCKKPTNNGNFLNTVSASVQYAHSIFHYDILGHILLRVMPKKGTFCPQNAHF